MLGVVAQSQFNGQVQGAVNQALDFFDYIRSQTDQCGYPCGSLSTPSDHYHRPHSVFLYRHWWESSHQGTRAELCRIRFGPRVVVGTAGIDVLHGEGGAQVGRDDIKQPRNRMD